jgi:hypothetical protein
MPGHWQRSGAARRHRMRCGCSRGPRWTSPPNLNCAPPRAGSYAEGVEGGAALSLGVFGGRQGTPAARLTRSEMPALDLHLRRPGYGEVVAAMIAEADRIASAVFTADRALIRRYFLITSRYEFLFWDAGILRPTCLQSCIQCCLTWRNAVIEEIVHDFV